MKEKLRVLHLEDDRIHADLARALLAEDGIECDMARVATEADFAAALDAGQIDLILADFTLPGFDGMTALATARERFPDLPFIFVTGTMGEEAAIEALKQGATDYVIKGRLSRLAPAVRRALSEAEERADRRRAEEALRRSEEKYRSLVDNISLGIALLSPDMEIMSLNNQMQQWFPHIDVSKRHLCHRSFNDPPSKEICGYCPVIKTLQDGEVHESITETPSGGKTRNFKVNTFPLKDKDGKVTAVIKMVEDVTERKRAEEELRHNHEMFRALIQASPLAIFLLNEDGTVKIWNPAAERIFGWSEREVQGQRLPIVPDDKREEFALICNQILQGQPVTGKELQRQSKNGATIDISLHAAPVFDAQGKASAILAMVADITERKRLDRELLQSERKFRTAFEDAAVGMCLTGIDLRFLVVNRSLCRMLGYTAEELSTMDWVEATHPDDREKCRTWANGIFAGEGHGSQMEKRYINRDGRIVWAMVSKALLRDDNGAPLYFINQVQDITELKNLENQLRHAQKMEALGTLSGGIAHDFNNILTAIIGYGSLLDMKLDGNDPSRPFVEHILAAADRAAGLTQSLLTFGRKQAIEPRVVDLNSIVQGVEKLLLRLLREDIDLRTTIADSPCMVMVDAGQIEQVLMNLATNARDAMQNGGKLAVATSMIKLDRDFVATHGYGAPGSYALLTVTDTGAGMDAETRSRIFEPFFTTKEVGKGTGLGLSMAYGIVKQHNGYVTCYSEPGEGTSFRVYLPVVNALAEQVIDGPAELPPGGTETILLAEDDEQVRVLTSKLLERFGYTVIEARDGKDALTQFFAHQDAIQLALLDVIMPGRNGREAYEEMRNKKPGLKALFTSGYSADIFQRWELDESGFAFISKPALPAELLKKIRHVLDESI
jgi:two-component system cell cycle sensor histidine kinase/response regulator CckA